MGFLGRLYQKVIISVDVGKNTCRLTTSYSKSSIPREERIFKTINGDLPIEAAKYIRHIKRKYPYSYIATMSRDKNQGLVNGSNMKSFENFDMNVNAFTIMLINKKWFVYIAKDALAENKANFIKAGGIDFIFSPFLLMFERVKTRLNEHKKLYILQEKDSCALLIADRNEVYFGNYIIFDKDVGEQNLQAEPNSALEFESIGEIDENIIIKDFETKDENNIGNLNDLSLANAMIDIIKSTLNVFYKDERYASDFIDELLILDGCGISDSVIMHLTNNIMLETHFLKIDICSELEKLAKLELKI